MNQAKLDILFFRRLWRLFRILFERYNARPALIFYFLTILSLILQFVIYGAGLVPSKFFEVLGAKDADAFPKLATYAILIITLNAVMKSSLNYVSRILYLTWRQRLCSNLHARYFSNINYYKLNVLDTSLDNMDQRITRDANLFTKEWSILVSKLVVIPFTIVYYSYQCFVSTTWLGPVIIYVYFIVGTIVNRLIMAPIVRLNVEQEIKEGDFRYQHLSVRVNSEAMAFYQAGNNEHHKSDEKLNTLLKTLLSLYNWSFWLNSSVNIFDYVGGILSYLIIAIPIFSGVYDDLPPEEIGALISKNSFVCIYLIHSFSQLIDMSSTIGDVAAHTHRLAQVFEATEQKSSNVNSEGKPSDGHENQTYDSESDVLVEFKDEQDESPNEHEEVSTSKSYNQQDGDTSTFFLLDAVTYFTPDNSIKLVESLTLKLQAGKNVLVSGATGSGKTSLLRVLAGLLAPASGTIKTFMSFGPRGVMYLPQKPLVIGGTIHDQVIYPRSHPYPEYSPTENETRVNDVLDEVGMTELVENNGGIHGRSEVNWSDKLSTGEMQCLSFARLFYHHPNLAVLDEPTSGLSKETENLMFKSCRKRKITCVTISHGTNLKQFHDIELHLLGGGEWTLSSLM